MTYLIVGRTGSGKDYIVNLLKKKGLSFVKSYTTRPPRTANENTHIFISETDADAFDDKDIAAYTKIGNIRYFSTKKQVMNSDVYVIDPDGIKTLIERMPDTIFHIVYIQADKMDRKFHALERETDKILAEQKFDARDAAENAQFSEFEKILKNAHDNSSTILSENVKMVYTYENAYDENNADLFTDQLIEQKKRYDRMTGIVAECIDMNIIRQDPENPTNAFLMYKDGHNRSMTAEQTAHILMVDTEGFHKVMMEYIAQTPKFAAFDKKPETMLDRAICMAKESLAQEPGKNHVDP